jgi:membrane protease YdiL (CAAX protease family)
MRKTQQILMTVFLSAIILSLFMVIVFENDWLPVGSYAGESQTEFYVAVIMEIVTICVIPVALKLFKFRSVRQKLVSENSSRELLRWGGLRLGMLCLPMVVNTLLYYLFMNVAFGYMGIILFLCLFFIVPTMERCTSETTNNE